MDRSKDQNSKIIVTGGGSGGHSATAVAVIEELENRYPGMRDRILFVGGNRGMEGEKNVKSIEEKMAREKGIPFIGIRSGKLQRRFSLKTFVGLFGVFGGIIDSFAIFKTRNVSFVFSTGGYVSVPVCFVAWLKKTPIVIHEQTTRVGLANKIAGMFARRILIGFQEAEQYFKKKDVVFVGNTIRKELLDSKLWPKSVKVKMRYLKKYADQYPIVFISGGGQGSHLLNSTVLMGLKSLSSHFQLIIITGDNEIYRDYEKLLSDCKKLSPEHQKRIIVTKFASAAEIGAYFDAADVFVGRGGAMFVYEIGTLGIPSVLIPIPWVTHNEQYHNAKVAEDIGLAHIVSEGVLSPEILFQEIQKMSTKVRNNMLRIDEDHRKEIFVTNAAERIADELESLKLL